MIEVDKVKRWVNDLPFAKWTTTKNNQEVIDLLRKEFWDFEIEFAEEDSRFRKMPIRVADEGHLKRFSKQKLVEIILQYNRIMEDLLDDHLFGGKNVK